MIKSKKLLFSNSIAWIASLLLFLIFLFVGLIVEVNNVNGWGALGFFIVSMPPLLLFWLFIILEAIYLSRILNNKKEKLLFILFPILFWKENKKNEAVYQENLISRKTSKISIIVFSILSFLSAFIIMVFLIVIKQFYWHQVLMGLWFFSSSLLIFTLILVLQNKIYFSKK